MSPARPAFRRPAHLAGARARCARGAALLAMLCLSCWSAAGLPGAAWAQAGFANEGTDILQGTQFGNQPTLFPADGRVRLLALALSPVDVTESAAEQIGLILQKNLSNTGHFAVVGPREINALFENQRPDLVDCREIACGVEIGKIIGAQKVLVGSLRRRGESFHLDVRLIEVVNNLTDYEEAVRFADDTMDEALFRLANSISDNTLVVGRVLSTSIRGIVLSLGIKDGIKLGDFLVIYKEDVPIANLEGQEIDRQRKNIAIVKILRVNDNTSEALLAHSVEEPQIAHFAATYRNPSRQTLLVEDTRRELDTGIRLENKLRPLELAPVALADSARREWQQRLTYAEAQQNFWYTVTAVGGIASLLVLSNYEDTNQVRILLAAALGVTGYGVYRSLEARDKLDEIQTEGRAKGFLNAGLDLHFGAGSIALSYNLKF
jgi:hypothetical protein